MLKSAHRKGGITMSIIFVILLLLAQHVGGTWWVIFWAYVVICILGCCCSFIGPNDFGPYDDIWQDDEGF